MFSLVKEIRDKGVTELVQLFKDKVNEFEEPFDRMKELELYRQNKSFIHNLLARIIHHIEEKCGVQSNLWIMLTLTSRNLSR